MALLAGGDPLEHRLIYQIDDVPPFWQTLGLGFQHYLTMFGATVAIPWRCPGSSACGTIPWLLAG